MSLNSELLQLYGRVWEFLPGAVARAQQWGVDWFEVSTPIVIRKDGRIVANTGIVECQLSVAGVLHKVHALHAVCVDPEYRGQGLGRRVVEEALAFTDRARADCVILWSEKTDFYAKFGFVPVRESVFVAKAPAPTPVVALPCDLASAEDITRLRAALESRQPVSSRLAAGDSGWHFLIDFAIWTEAFGVSPDILLTHLPEHGGFLVSELDGEILRLFDYVGPSMPPVSALVGARLLAAGPSPKHLEIYFSPDRLDIDTEAQAPAEEDVLMVRGDWITDAQAPFALSPMTRT